MSSPIKENATKYSSNNLPDYIQNACDWANMRGWKVFPTVANEKRPCIKDPFGRATNNREEIIKLFSDYPGAGFGGSCFPKDLKALRQVAKEHHYEAELISAVENVNNRQKHVISRKVIDLFGEDLSGKVFGVWGLAFKPGTDDMRESPAIYVINDLVRKGARVNVYDPKAMKEAKNHYLKDIKEVTYVDSKYQVLANAEALILLTEWKEFRSPDFDKIKSLLKSPIIFDGRNQYNAFNLEEMGIEYYQIGKQ